MADIDGSAKILPNFTFSEIANTSAQETVKLQLDLRAQRIMLPMLQITRDHFGPMPISSFYRTKTFNASVGGDPKSCHLVAWAFDMPLTMTEDVCRRWSDWWKVLCRDLDQVGAINLYDNYVHCEIGSDIRYGNKTFVVRDKRGGK